MRLLLAIDVGNTNIVLGVFDLDQVQNTLPLHSWRVATARERTADEYGLTFQELLRHRGMELSMVSEMVVASVVPPLHPVLETCCQRYFNINPLWIEPGVETGLKIIIDNPNELGADRIVNCVGAIEMFGAPVIVVDMGTATTFDVVNEKSEYLGGLILPGIKIAAEALFQRAARLPRVEIAKPEKLVGRSTVQAMQSGLYYGCIGQIDGILERLTQQFPKAVVAAAGGLAKTVGKESKFIKHVVPDLTLSGLHSIWSRNRRKNNGN
ncbi:MAG: type III pantothenate kinase [Holophagales bacterium]|jgi:type III pantothenate kinase|nr:type III pantothenate kinase [Holophagales bacterium]